MPRVGKYMTKIFDYPPRSSVLLSMGKTALKVIMETIAHPLANKENFVHAFFGETQKIPFVITYGTSNQGESDSEFGGSQCTSMSIAALAWWSLSANMHFFTPRDIDNVLILGDEWHTYFRKVKVLSTEADRKVSLDDIPNQIEANFYGRTILITRCDDDMFLLTSPTRASEIEGFGCLEAFLSNYQEMHNNAPAAFLITVDIYSNGLMYTSAGVWLWFDSHGFMTVNNTSLKGFSSVIELASLRHLIMFIVALRGPGELCQIVPMKFLDEKEPTEPKKPLSAGLSDQAEAPKFNDMSVESEYGEPIYIEPVYEQADAQKFTDLSSESDCSEPLYTEPVYSPRASEQEEVLKFTDLFESENGDSVYTKPVYYRLSKPGASLKITDLTAPGYAEESLQDAVIEAAAAPGSKAREPSESSEADEESAYVALMGGFGDYE